MGRHAGGWWGGCAAVAATCNRIQFVAVQRTIFSNKYFPLIWVCPEHRHCTDYYAISRISINFDIWQFNLLKFSSSVKYHHQSAVILHTFKSMQKWCNFNFSPNNKYWNNPILVRTMPIISLGQQHYYHSQLCSGDQVIQYFCLVKYFLHYIFRAFTVDHIMYINSCLPKAEATTKA